MRYFLAHNEIDVFHYGEVLESQVVTTGQPNLEYFDSLDFLKDRLSFFNINYEELDGQVLQIEEFSAIEIDNAEETDPLG